MTKMNWTRVRVEDRQRRHRRKQRMRVGVNPIPSASRRRPRRSRHRSSANATHVRRQLRPCPYCAAPLATRNYDGHITERCPKRPAAGVTVSSPSPVHPRTPTFTAATRCDICDRTVPARNAAAHFEQHREQWQATGSVVRLAPALKAKRHESHRSAPSASARRRSAPVAGDGGKSAFVVLAVCIDADRRRFLAKGKIYRITAASTGGLRVRDDSGEARTYPTALFVRVRLSQRIQRALWPGLGAARNREAPNETMQQRPSRTGTLSRDSLASR